jgi:HSP20 family protein
MWRPKISNRTFDWMGEKFAPLIDRDHFLGHSAIGNLKWNLPLVNIRKNGRLFEMELLIPGFEKDEIEIIVEDDILTVRGETTTKKVKSSEYILEEFDVKSFERRFCLGAGIGHEKIDATLKHGVLRLTFTDVPKEKEVEYQEIEVK